jgi:predicted metal-binding protein
VSIVPRVSASQQTSGLSHHPEFCNCQEPCPGYDSRENCPPLIVFAVLATVAEDERIFLGGMR